MQCKVTSLIISVLLKLKEEIPGCCTQLSQTREGVNRLTSFPLLSANSELLHGAELLQLIGEGTHLFLQGIDGTR